jgi:hypothetical protein
MLRSFLLLQILLLPLALTAWLLLRSGGGRAALLGMRGLLTAAVLASLGLGLLSSASPPPIPEPVPAVHAQVDATAPSAFVTPMAPATPLPSLPTWPLALLPLLGLGLAHNTLKRRVARQTLSRTLGKVELRTGGSAWSAWLPGRRVVVLNPEQSAQDRALTLRHELQHHRQGDPQWAWLLLGLQVLCFMNPAVHLLARSLRALEELACDAALLERGTSARAYGQALLRAASAHPAPLAIAFHTPTLLEGRLTMLKKRQNRKMPWILSLGLLIGSGVAVAAELAVPHVQATSRFEVPEHPVMDQARERLDGEMANFMTQGLERYPQWAPMVHTELQAWGLPPELAAVPLIESGYQNLGSYNPGESAAPGVPGKGLWMFIPSTARTYGLRVNPEQDQRLDPVLETRAAAALLSDLHAEFEDWGLALAGYNQGSTHVRDAIESQGTNDWATLVESGALNHYSTLVFAASEKLPEQ